MLGALVRHLSELRPDVVLCFQHYGNIVGALAGRLAGAKAIIANRTSAKVLEPRWTRFFDLAFGMTGLFSRVVVNSKDIEDEYAAIRADIGRGWRASIMASNPRAANSAAAPRGGRLRCPMASPFWAASRGFIRSRSDAAIRLLAIHQDWHLALAGQGPAQAQLENLAKSLGVLNRLHLMGELSPAQVAVFLRTLDVFVFPSQAESFGLAAVEAAQAGIPVVANDLRVLREVLSRRRQALRFVRRCGQPGNLCRRGAKPARRRCAQGNADGTRTRAFTALFARRHGGQISCADRDPGNQFRSTVAAMTDLAGSYPLDGPDIYRARQPLRLRRKFATTRLGRSEPQGRRLLTSPYASIHRNCVTCTWNWHDGSAAMLASA